MQARVFRVFLVAVVGVSIAVLTASCSSSATNSSSPTSSTRTTVKHTTSTGLCMLVNPSVVATALSANMAFPTTLVERSTTECVYRAKDGTGTIVLIRYDTHSGPSNFAKNREIFVRRGQKLGSVTGLGDQSYYFSERTGNTTVTTVVVLQGSLQVLTTGTATLDQIGSIARYAVNQFEATHLPATSAS